MKKPIGKIGTILIILATIVLAGVAIFTAFKLYQLRQQPVAPNVPSSLPKADEVTTSPSNNCSISFTISTTTPSPTPTPSPSPSPTPSPTPTPPFSPSPTPTPTPTGSPNSCGGTCGSNLNCNSDLYCYDGYCRNPSCPSETDCTCSGTSTPSPTPTNRISTASPTPTAPALPESGTNWPTLIGTGIGILVILGAMVLAI